MTDDEMIPYDVRPRRQLLLAAAPFLASDEYLRMTEREFVNAVMRATGAGANPKTVLELFRELRAESGIPIPEHARIAMTNPSPPERG